jgi:peroxiredoxin
LRIAYAALLIAPLLPMASCAPPRTPESERGGLPVFAFWLECPPEYDPLRLRAADSLKKVMAEAGFEVIESSGPESADTALPHELALYGEGRRMGADVVCFGRLVPAPPAQNVPAVGLEYGLFDFRTGLDLHDTRIKPAAFLDGFFARHALSGWAAKTLAGVVEQTRRRGAEPFQKDAGARDAEAEWKSLPDRAMVGVQVEPVDAKALTGARVVWLTRGGPAEAAGVKPGDLLKTVAAKKRRDVRAPADLIDFMRSVSVGDAVTMTVSTGSKERQAAVKAASWKELARKDRQSMAGKPAPDFKFSPAPGNGDLRDFSSLRGNYALVDFWSPMSPASIRGLMGARWLSERWEGRLAVISVALDDPEAAQKITGSGFITWSTASDPDRDLAKKFGLTGVPSWFLIDPKGTIIAADLAETEMDRLLRSLLEPRKVKEEK